MRRANPLSFIRQELKQLWSSRLARVGIVGVMLIPLLYAGTYLWAFWDPTGHLERVPAAIVNEDVPATVDTTTVAAGSGLATKLTDANTFAWTVTTRDEATAGVADGTYYFALIIPSDFSTAIASAADPATARQASFSLLLNDANSYIATTVASRAVSEVRAQLASQVASGDVEGLLVGLAEVRTGVSSAAKGATALSDGLAKLRTGTTTLADGASQVASGAASLSSGASGAATGASSLSSGLAALRDGSTRLANGTKQLGSGASTLADGASSAATGGAALAEGTAKVADGAKDLVSGSSTLSAATADLASGSVSVANGAATVAAGNGQLAATLANLSDDPNLDPTTRATLAAVARKASTLADGAAQVANGASAAAAGADRLRSGVATLAAGATDLSTGASATATGAAELARGTASLANGATTLAAGVGQVDAATQDLASGAADAATGARRLASGTSDLAAGAAALAEGSGGVATGASDVASGTRLAAAGASTLATRLADGATSIPVLTGTQATSASRSIGSPVTVDTVHGTAPATYGVGLAPYFIGLALWVGAVFAFGLIRPVAKRRSAGRVDAGGRVIAGFAQASILTGAQALVLLAVLVLALGLNPALPIVLAAFLVFTAIAFAAVVQALNALLGGVGRVVAILLLILQLAASGGTYPIETSPAFFQALNPYLPMTYFINALRRLISGGSLEPVASAVIVLLGVTAGSLLVTWAITRVGREKEAMMDFGPAKEEPVTESVAEPVAGPAGA